MFSKKDLRRLLIPLIIEQILTGLMGIADTFMVSNVGEAAVSGVALVDSINMLVSYFFTALAAGGTIVVAQYIGREDEHSANRACGQVITAAVVLSTAVCLILIPLRRPVLGLIFGDVEQSVMDASVTYLLITAASYPFLAAYTTGAALFRAIGRSDSPLYVAGIADVMNIIGNAVLIFVFHMGVAGAAIATLASRVFSTAAILFLQQRSGTLIAVRSARILIPDWAMTKRILRVGLPNALENGMFQFGKLVVQSTVAVLGTTAIASQAIVAQLESFGSMPGQAIGTGLLTVAGQCIGRGDKDGARAYTRRFTLYSMAMTAATGILLSCSVPFVVKLTGLSVEGARLTCRLTWFICSIKVVLWPPGFTMPNGLRAAGDVTYSMVVSTVCMWVFRVALSWYLCRYTSVGLWGIWIGWCTDWLIRAGLYIFRFRGQKWLRFSILD